MAIGYARIEFVKRSSGKNACAKAAYNSRSEIEFQGTDLADPKVYDWSNKPKPALHDVLIPHHVDLRFKNPQTLWNTAEAKEIKSNAQVAMEAVLALPDDKMISLEDKIHLTQSFVQQHFVDPGLAAQIDIHAPEPIIIITRNNEELGLKQGMKGDILKKEGHQLTIQLENGTRTSFDSQEFTGFIEKEHNWHAHILLTTRRFKENGLEFEDHKARDLMPRILKGKVVSGPDWGKLWAEHQNQYFEEKGLDLRVDINGLVPQEHLGPHRMRARAFSLFEEHQRLLDLNKNTSKNPSQILKAITSERSVFTSEDVERFITKHTPTESIEPVLKEFWKLPQVIQLADKNTGELLSKFSSQEVLEEEERILRLADRLQGKQAFPISEKYRHAIDGLNDEQQKAYQQIIQGRKLTLLQGYAGTGKSYLLKALQTTYERAGYRVRAFGPDSATTDVLKEKGLSHTENVYRFLFAAHHQKRRILKGKEVWVLDEAGKLGNGPLLELLKEADKHHIQLILAGDSAQLPPVERGGMFRLLCERYGSEVLADIQRQKNLQQREVAQLLAKGEFGHALDQMSRMKAFRWADTKNEAMEQLVVEWSKHARGSPGCSTLIIAHSNAEVRVLNEMVRLVRRQRGELQEKEFQCTTPQGRIFVSVGDWIEFRRNDKNLGVSNGLSGVLIEAAPDKFVVSIRKDNKKNETVVFNPEEYHAFQLGYASTFYRSQGRTVDRAYVLHSPMMNKQMFYVGLTRHIKNVSYYVSKEEVCCLSDLKYLSTKSHQKQLSQEYTTQMHLHQFEKAQARHLEIAKLKESESALDKIKGYGLSTWDKVLGKAGELKERIQDRRPSQGFYQTPSLAPEPLKEGVVEVTESLTTLPSSEQGSDMLEQIRREDISETPLLPFPKAFKAFKAVEQRALQDYNDACQEAAVFKQLVMAEAESTGKDLRLTSQFRKWQEVCGHRNKLAYELLQTVFSGEKKDIPNKSLEILQAQAARYEVFMHQNSDQAKQSLEDQLKASIEPLLYKLYPEGPTSKDRHNFRFRNKGSLSVAHSGTKAGQFYDFEQNHGGGLLKLIQIELGLGKREARLWAEEFLGKIAHFDIPAGFLKRERDSKPEDVWVSLKPPSDQPAPSLENIEGRRLDKYFNEVCRHAYRDIDGEMLYYVLRLHSKSEPKQKVTPPLSYGYWKSKPDQLKWELKGYKEEQRSLYNLHQLKQHPLAPVLVVEGEKTADLGLKKFPKDSYICVTWPGGAGAVEKADWTPLTGRRVWVWPDNDLAGIQAASKVCQELRKVGVESLQQVEVSDLKKLFPEKWDLADELPAGVSEQLLRKMLAQAPHNGINPEQLLIRLSLNPQDRVLRARLNEILWRVDERSRPVLEQKYGNQYWKVQEEILKETQRLFLDQEKQKPGLREKFGIESQALESLSYQVCLARAQRGRNLKTNEIEVIKETIQQHGYVNLPKSIEKTTYKLLTDRLLSKACEKALEGVNMSSRLTQEKKVLSLKSLEQQTTQMKIMENLKHYGIAPEKEIHR